MACPKALRQFKMGRAGQSRLHCTGPSLVPLVVSGAPYQGPIICALTSLVMVNGAPRR